MFMFTKLCRLCINDKDVASTLNNFDSDNFVILDKLNRIAPGLLKLNNNLPIGICKTCITQLNQSYKFLQNCFRSQEILEKYLEQLQNGQYTEQEKCYEIMIKERKLAETNVFTEKIEQIYCNNVIMKNELETNSLDEEYIDKYNGMRNTPTNYDEQSNFMKQENVAGSSEYIHVNFEDVIKVEEIDIKHNLTDIETQVAEKGFIDLIDIETNISVKNELECPSKDVIALLTDSKNEITEENHSENNINDDYFTEIDVEHEIKIEEHEIKGFKFCGFNSAECSLANNIKMKYNLELERLRDNKTLNFMKQENVAGSSEYIHVNFEDVIKVEEIDIKHNLTDIETQVAEEGFIDLIDIDTNISVKNELECPSKDVIALLTDLKNEITEENHSENNINDDYFTEIDVEHEIKIEEHEIKIEEHEIKGFKLCGFNSAECSLANNIKMKYNLELERLRDNKTLNFMKQENVAGSSEYIHVNFEDVIKVEEIDVKHNLTDIETQVAEEGFIDLIDIETNISVKNELEYPSKDVIALLTDSKNEITEENHSENNINDDYFTEIDVEHEIKIEEHEIKIEEHEIKIEEHEIKGFKFCGFNSAECSLANNIKMKYNLELERLRDNKTLKAYIENTEINKQTINHNIQPGISFENSRSCEESSFRDDSNLKTYSHTRTEKKRFQCKICEKVWVSRSKLKRHMRMHTQEKPYNCKICNKSFRQNSHLKNHMHTHTKEKSYKCEICNKTFSRKASLKIHMHTHTQEKPYKCEICKRTFSISLILKYHMRTHTQEKPYECEVCNKSFRQNMCLKYHMRIHTKEKPYNCEICRKTFSRKDNLKLHMRIHTQEKPYKCDICNKTFSQNSSLKLHMRIHTQEKPYKCDICNKTFCCSTNLKVHIRTHTQEKPYKCEICNASFSQNCNLKVHIRTHTQEKPYKCEICNVSFSQNCNLKVHLRIHLQKKPYKCEICNSTFADRSTLKQHIYIHI